MIYTEMEYTPDPRMSRDRRTVNCAKKSTCAASWTAAYVPTHCTLEAMVETPE